jgi:transglutaminase-like putative cysteine protease
MKNYLIILLLILPALNLRSQSYVAAAIPDSLKANADVVVRLDETTVEIKSPARMMVRRHYVYTILNERALKYATYRVEYDKFSSVNTLNAALYDASGKEQGHLRKKDIKDIPAEDGMSLVNDDRIKMTSFVYRTYPFTVDVEEEIEWNGFMNIPAWRIPRSAKVSVEASLYNLIVPKGYQIKYKLMNADIAPSVSEKSDKLIYHWEMKNLTVTPDEPFAVSWTAYEPFMMVSPSDVEIGGYKGNLSTWSDFARFYGNLQKGRDVLPDAVKASVHELTGKLTDVRKKVAVLYDYLQKNTHYVNISLGIGGWQAFDATYVANNKYGDCKALSNFMVALLKEAGIRAYPVIIQAGEQNDDFVKDFTYNQFNHVLCCVPLDKDTVWLECVDQFLPPGYLSNDFTANRYGLLIDDNGGELVHTPAYSFSDSRQERHIAATVDETGTLQVHSRTNYQAASQDDMESLIDHYSKDDQLRVLKTAFDLPTYDVNEFECEKDYSKRLPVITSTLQLTVTDYAQVSGKRIFFSPDILTRSRVKLAVDKNRRLDIAVRNEFSQIDSIQIAVPAGYEPEAMPRPVSLESKFGRYEAHAVFEPGKILYYRSFECYSGRFPRTDYGELARFYNEIYKSDHARIVLLKKS